MARDTSTEKMRVLWNLRKYRYPPSDPANRFERFLVVLEFWPEIRNSRCARRVRHERLSLTLETPKMENVIKTQLFEELFIVDEADIFYWLAIEQTWIAQLLLNLERRCHIQRFAGLTENIVPQFDNKKFFRHFRVSPEIFELIMNSIVHLSQMILHGPVGQNPYCPKKASSVFMVHGKSGNVKRSEQHIFLTL